MNDEEAMKMAVQAAPDDNVARLVYADALDENGKPEEAQLVRIGVNLAQGVYAHDENKLFEMADAYQQMMAEQEAKYRARLAEEGCTVKNIHFDRGMIDKISLSEEMLRQHAELIAQETPMLTELHFDDDRGYSYPRNFQGMHAVFMTLQRVKGEQKSAAKLHVLDLGQNEYFSYGSPNRLANVAELEHVLNTAPIDKLDLGISCYTMTRLYTEANGRHPTEELMRMNAPNLKEICFGDTSQQTRTIAYEDDDSDTRLLNSPLVFGGLTRMIDVYNDLIAAYQDTIANGNSPSLIGLERMNGEELPQPIVALRDQARASWQREHTPHFRVINPQVQTNAQRAAHNETRDDR